MPTLARILELNIFRTQEFVNLTSFIFSTLKASKDNVMLAYHGAIANVVDQTFPVPKTAEADGTMSVHVNISAPNISNPMFLKHMEAKLLNGAETRITLTARKRGVRCTNIRFDRVISYREDIGNTKFNKILKLESEVLGILPDAVTPMGKRQPKPITIHWAGGEPHEIAANSSSPAACAVG